MKIQIDTKSKTIKIEEEVNLEEFFGMLTSFFPNDKWKEFSLKTEVIIDWVNPIVIPCQPVYPVYPTYPYPWNEPIITYKDSSGSAPIADGVYNIEVKS